MAPVRRNPCCRLHARCRSYSCLFPIRSAAGYVDSLARPGGNATGFTSYEYGMGGKWLELLKQIAPRVTRVGVLRDTGQVAAVGQFAAIQSVAPSLGIEVIPVNMRDADGIENGISGFARSATGGLIVPGSGLAVVNRDLIITLAAQHQLPAIYCDRLFVSAGGLISYGADLRRPVPARGRLRRSHPQGREAGRSAGAGTDQVRAGRSTSRPPRRSASKCRRSLLARADEVIE